MKTRKRAGAVPRRLALLLAVLLVGLFTAVTYAAPPDTGGQSTPFSDLYNFKQPKAVTPIVSDPSSPEGQVGPSVGLDPQVAGGTLVGNDAGGAKNAKSAKSAGSSASTTINCQAWNNPIQSDQNGAWYEKLVGQLLRDIAQGILNSLGTCPAALIFQPHGEKDAWGIMSPQQWQRIQGWYELFRALAMSGAVLAIIAVIVGFVIAKDAFTGQKKARMDDTLWRLGAAFLVIIFGPILAKVLFEINSGLVSSVTNYLVNVRGYDLNQSALPVDLRHTDLLLNSIAQLVISGLSAYFVFLFDIRAFMVAVTYAILPLTAWSIAKNGNFRPFNLAFSEFLSNTFMQSAYAIAWAIYMEMAGAGNTGFLQNWIWHLFMLIMVIPVAQLLQRLLTGWYELLGVNEGAWAGLGATGFAAAMGIMHLGAEMAGIGSFRDLMGRGGGGGGGGGMTVPASGGASPGMTIKGEEAGGPLPQVSRARALGTSMARAGGALGHAMFGMAGGVLGAATGNPAIGQAFQSMGRGLGAGVLGGIGTGVGHYQDRKENREPTLSVESVDFPKSLGGGGNEFAPPPEPAPPLAPAPDFGPPPEPMEQANLFEDLPVWTESGQIGFGYIDPSGNKPRLGIDPAPEPKKTGALGNSEVPNISSNTAVGQRRPSGERPSSAEYGNPNTKRRSGSNGTRRPIDGPIG